MADAGVPVHHLRKIAGHGSLTTTQRYLQPDQQSVTDAAAPLSGHLRGSRTGPELRHHAARTGPLSQDRVLAALVLVGT
jgi:hypothetical protein